MDKIREAFEKWAKTECLDLDSIDGFYSGNDTHIAWGAWKAAKSAAVPVVGDVVAYDLSADYVKLLEFIKAGNDAAGFVTTDDYHNGDVVGVTRRGPYNIHIGVRGYSFASVYPFNSEDGSEEEVFIKACEFSRLKWIKPTHSITAAELATLREKAAMVDTLLDVPDAVQAHLYDDTHEIYAHGFNACRNLWLAAIAQEHQS